ncbi:MAG TPA: alpha/beta hydrolase [Nitrososphaera sp.]|jgi:pimeloyl-ACP methyl ester carboxylesterase
MPYVNVGQENSGRIRLYYEDHGSGKPVVLIHGWPLSGRSWEKQVPILVENGYRAITYDRRGFGGSSRPISGYDYDTFAMDLHILLTTLGLEDVTLVGFSMGGGEVARYIGTYGSDRVKKAAFIAAIPPFLLKTADNPEGIDRDVFDVIKAGITADRLAFLSGFFANFYNVDVLGGRLISEEAVKFSWSIAASASPKGMLDSVSAWLTDFRKDLERINVPTLLIHGDSDRITPMGATASRTHEIVKNSRLAVVPGGPHGLNWTHAEQVNAELLDFLRKPQTQVASV